MSPNNLLEAITELRAQLEASELSLGMPGGEEAKRERTELIDQIDDYLVPRLRRVDAPLLAVLGGSSDEGPPTE